MAGPGFSVLRNTLLFSGGSLAGGASSTQPHELNVEGVAILPDVAWVTQDDDGTVRVLLEYWHKVTRVLASDPIPGGTKINNPVGSNAQVMVTNTTVTVTLVGPRQIKGTVDPTVGAGVAAPEGSIYQMNAAGAGEFFVKQGPLATDWVGIIAYVDAQVNHSLLFIIGDGTNGNAPALTGAPFTDEIYQYLTAVLTGNVSQVAPGTSSGLFVKANILNLAGFAIDIQAVAQGGNGGAGGAGGAAPAAGSNGSGTGGSSNYTTAAALNQPAAGVLGGIGANGGAGNGGVAADSAVAINQPGMGGAGGGGGGGTTVAGKAGGQSNTANTIGTRSVTNAPRAILDPSLIPTTFKPAGAGSGGGGGGGGGGAGGGAGGVGGKGGASGGGAYYWGGLLLGPGALRASGTVGLVGTKGTDSGAGTGGGGGGGAGGGGGGGGLVITKFIYYSGGATFQANGGLHGAGGAVGANGGVGTGNGGAGSDGGDGMAGVIITVVL